MIIYFSGTGNSLAISQKIAEETNDSLLPLALAADENLKNEQTIGLVYPCYDFNTPPAVREMVPRLQIDKDAYVFIIITCGAQAGNSVWTVRQLLKKKGINVAYCHKIRVPDNSAIVFGRNPNEQKWKFDKYAPRLEQIIDDIKNHRRSNHFGSPGLLGWLMGLPAIERKLLENFRPQVSKELCVGCGLCISVCPIGNIVMDGEQKAIIGDVCSCCLGCVHCCPKQAIMINGKAVQKESQYRHPSVKNSDLVKFKIKNK